MFEDGPAMDALWKAIDEKEAERKKAKKKGKKKGKKSRKKKNDEKNVQRWAEVIRDFDSRTEDIEETGKRKEMLKRKYKFGKALQYSGVILAIASLLKILFG